LIFGKRSPLSDVELYSNLDASFLTYIEYLTAYLEDSDNPLTFEKFMEDEIQAT